MKIEFVGPFVEHAARALAEAAQVPPERGPLTLTLAAPVTSQDLTAIVGVEGDLVGAALYGASLGAVERLSASGVRREEVEEANDVSREERGERALGELAQDICAAVGEELAQAGHRCELTEPRIVRGAGVATTGIGPSLTVPLITPFGEFHVCVGIVGGAEGALRSV